MRKKSEILAILTLFTISLIIVALLWKIFSGLGLLVILAIIYFGRKKIKIDGINALDQKTRLKSVIEKIAKWYESIEK